MCCFRHLHTSSVLPSELIQTVALHAAQELYSLRVRRGRQATSRNTGLSFPSATRRRMLSVSCEAFFPHPWDEHQAAEELMSEHAAYCPLPVVLVVENDIFERM